MHTLFAPLVADLRPRGAGWAATSLTRSIRRVTLGMIAVWQVVMILAAAVSIGWSAWPLMTLNALLGGAAVLALSRFPALPVWPMSIAMAYLGLAAYVSSGDLASVLVFAACWQVNFAICAIGLTMLGRAAVPVAMMVAISISAGLVVLVPEWGFDLPVTITVTQASIILALRFGLPPLLALAHRTDHEEQLSAEAIERAEVAQRTSLQVAEEARVLHDTAINTLGAIANGGVSIANTEQVQRQCRKDLAVLTELQSARSEPQPSAQLLVEALQGSWTPIRRAGATDEDLVDAVADVDARAVAGFAGAVRESLTNASKHSGAPLIDVLAAVDQTSLTIEVSDRGVGFDPSVVHTRGLARSVQERAEELGFTVHIASTPGRGTRVVLSLPLNDGVERATDPIDSSARVERTIRGLLQRGALLWAGGVTAVSVILTATNSANHTLSAVVMIAIMVGVTVLARVAVPDRRGRWVIAILVLAPSAIFFCTAVTTGFGSVNALHWQALAPTAPFVLLIARRVGRSSTVTATVLWIGTALGIMVLGLPATLDAYVIVAVALAVGLGFGVVWDRFQYAVAQLCSDSAASSQRVFWADLEAKAAQAAQRTYLRWIDTGLDPTIQLMRELVDGTRDAQAHATRVACGHEERYLRQVIQVGPDLMHLGQSVFPTMRLAHDRGIDLTLRLGDQDAADRIAANEIANEITAVIKASTPADRIVASLFPVREGLQLTLVRLPEPLIEETTEMGETRHAESYPLTSQFIFPLTLAA